MDNNLNMSQQCTAAAVKSNRILGCIRKGITSRDSDQTTLLSTCQAVPGVLFPALVCTIQERCGKTGDGPKEATKIIKKATKKD